MNAIKAFLPPSPLSIEKFRCSVFFHNDLCRIQQLYRPSLLPSNKVRCISTIFDGIGKWNMLSMIVSTDLVTRPKHPPPPYRETVVAMPLPHCVSCGIADYHCYTPTFLNKNGLPQFKDSRLTRGALQKKLASEAYCAIGGIA